MPKTATTTARLFPFALLILEIIIFYSGFGLLFGAWNSEYPHDSDLHFIVTFFYVFGVLTFLFFAITLLPPTIKQSFIAIIIFFIISIMPCLFLSFALTNTLWLNVPYTQSLKEMWDVRKEFIPFLTSHTLGFMIALTLRKILKPISIQRIKKHLTFTDEP